MCDPISIGVTAAVVGTGASVYGQVKQGQAQKKAGAQQQKAFAEAAQQRLDKVAYDIDKTGRDYTRKRGENLAATGTTGISKTSFYDVLADNAYERQREIAALKYSGDVEASQLKKSGAIAFQAGQSAASASIINAGATALNGISGIAMSGAFSNSSSTWSTTTTNAAGQIV